jgi:hypothetical protein
MQPAAAQLDATQAERVAARQEVQTARRLDHGRAAHRVRAGHIQRAAVDLHGAQSLHGGRRRVAEVGRELEHAARIGGEDALVGAALPDGEHAGPGAHLAQIVDDEVHESLCARRLDQFALDQQRGARAGVVEVFQRPAGLHVEAGAGQDAQTGAVVGAHVAGVPDALAGHHQRAAQQILVPVIPRLARDQVGAARHIGDAVPAQRTAAPGEDLGHGDVAGGAHHTRRVQRQVGRGEDASVGRRHRAVAHFGQAGKGVGAGQRGGAAVLAHRAQPGNRAADLGGVAAAHLQHGARLHGQCAALHAVGVDHRRAAGQRRRAVKPQVAAHVEGTVGGHRHAHRQAPFHVQQGARTLAGQGVEGGVVGHAERAAGVHMEHSAVAAAQRAAQPLGGAGDRQPPPVQFEAAWADQPTPRKIQHAVAEQAAARPGERFAHGDGAAALHCAIGEEERMRRGRCTRSEIQRCALQPQRAAQVCRRRARGHREHAAVGLGNARRIVAPGHAEHAGGQDELAAVADDAAGQHLVRGCAQRQRRTLADPQHAARGAGSRQGERAADDVDHAGIRDHAVEIGGGGGRNLAQRAFVAHCGLRPALPPVRVHIARDVQRRAGQVVPDRAVGAADRAQPGCLAAVAQRVPVQ